MVKASLAALLFAAADAADYTLYHGFTSYAGHGGREIDSDSTAPTGLTVASCESRCDSDGVCDCVSFRPADGKCWKRADCVPSEFGADSNFDTYVKKSSAGDCLCIFDIDRTLTGKQEDTSQCPRNAVQSGVRDDAYGGGTLTLSELAQAVSQTFCSKCHLSTISAGSAGGEGSQERGVLHDRLAAADSTHTLPEEWNSASCSVTSSPLVTSCTDGQKQTAVPGIIQWYKEHAGAKIADSDVHFFDDRGSNISPFRGLGYNARQISCNSRDSGGKGLCGAELSEIVDTPGVALCGGEQFV